MLLAPLLILFFLAPSLLPWASPKFYFNPFSIYIFFDSFSPPLFMPLVCILIPSPDHLSPHHALVAMSPYSAPVLSRNGLGPFQSWPRTCCWCGEAAFCSHMLGFAKHPIRSVWVGQHYLLHFLTASQAAVLFPNLSPMLHKSSGLPAHSGQLLEALQNYTLLRKWIMLEWRCGKFILIYNGNPWATICGLDPMSACEIKCLICDLLTASTIQSILQPHIAAMSWCRMG